MYFGPNDYLFGPVYTNDSVFVSPSLVRYRRISLMVTTADPHCLFVDSTHGMNGSYNNCATANGDVSPYDATNSSYGHAVESPRPTTPS